jgi:TetR/AcrR family transcriptional regulator, cholesterol catabolism regulator
MDREPGTVQTLNKKDRKQKGAKRERLTQKAIVTAAAELFARNGFGASSLDDIAAVLGATKGALYYHIKNKEEILRLIFLTVLTASEEPLSRLVKADLPPTEKLRRAIEHQASTAADRSPAMTVFFHEQAHLTGPFAKEILLRKKAYAHYFEQIIREGQEVGAFQPDIDPRLATFGLLGMCNSLSQWYRAGGPFSPAQIAATFTTMLEHGLTRSPSPVL